MTTETPPITTEAQGAHAAFRIKGPSSVEWALGRLEGQNQVLLHVLREQGLWARGDYHALVAKIDRLKSELDAKIDGVKMDPAANIDSEKSDPAADMDERNQNLLQIIHEQGRQSRQAYRTLDAKIDGLRYAIDKLQQKEFRI